MHASFCCIYSLSCLSLSQSSHLGESLSITFMTMSMGLCWWLIHRLFIKHFMSTEDPHSSEGVPALKSASLNCNPLLCCGSCSCFPNYLLIHFLPWSSKTVLLSFNCSVKVVVRIKENMCEGFKIVLTKINSNHVGSNYSSCRSRGNPWHVFSLCSYYKSVFQDIISEANRTKLHKMGKIIIAILLS